MGGATLVEGNDWGDTYCFNAARGFVGGATSSPSWRTPLRWCFNAARGFVGGATGSPAAQDERFAFQCRTRLCGWCNAVSRDRSKSHEGFNAARGFVGGATAQLVWEDESQEGFNAARGFVGGAASSLSALVPLRGKRPFGKSPEI